MTTLVKEWLSPGVSVEEAERFLAEAEADGRRIDLATAEFSTHYRAHNDPYGIYGNLPDEEIYGTSFPTTFVRDPVNGVELEVWVGDLPEEMLEAAQSRERELDRARGIIWGDEKLGLWSPKEGTSR